MKAALIFLSLCFCFISSIAQQGKPTPANGADSARRQVMKPEPKSFKDLITEKAVSSKGLFTVYRQDEKYYFEIPDSLLGRLFMAITRISKAPTSLEYGGKEVNREVLQWEKSTDGRLLLRCVGFINRSKDSTQSIFQAVRNSNVDPIVGAFEIKAIKRDTSSIIDMTEFFKADNQVVSLPPEVKQQFRLTGLAGDRSFISSIRSFPINTEIKTIKTYGVMQGPPPPGANVITLPGGADAGVVSMELNTSMILLPATPMRKRFGDYRVGYFFDTNNSYADASQKVTNEFFIQRFRLEPKNREDEEKARRGELIEPAKPIIFYIDPATPKQWRKYFIQGINDWQRCFEKAGWKNAIQGKEWPENDSSMSLDDARFNVIRYFASEVENAEGPRIHDPRSGEIIESHIYWYHNVINIFKHLYAIQVGYLDPRAQHPEFEEELVGRIIRYVSCHEVGHTIGLLHNHIASNAIPVEKYRDKGFQKQYGLTPSIMEYARLNYIAQPEDGIELEDLWSKIGVYDDWAIQFGYKVVFDAKDEWEEKRAINNWVVEAQKNPMLRFGLQEHPFDPRINNEDLGDNQMKANEYGIKNMKRILSQQPEWTKEEGRFSDLLRERYSIMLVQLNWYFNHVVKYIGGVYDHLKTSDQQGSMYEVTPKALQKEAVAFMIRNLFDTPEWLLNRDVIGRIRPDAGVNRIRAMQESYLYNIFSFSRMQRLIENAAIDKNTYSLNDLFTDMQKGIWSELELHKPIDVYRRDLQKVYIQTMAAILDQKTTAPGVSSYYSVITPGGSVPLKADTYSEAKASLRWVQSRIRSALPLVTDMATRNHLLDVQDRIKNLLEPR